MHKSLLQTSEIVAAWVVVLSFSTTNSNLSHTIWAVVLSFSTTNCNLSHTIWVVFVLDKHWNMDILLCYNTIITFTWAESKIDSWEGQKCFADICLFLNIMTHIVRQKMQASKQQCKNMCHTATRETPSSYILYLDITASTQLIIYDMNIVINVISSPDPSSSSMLNYCYKTSVYHPCQNTVMS